MRERVGLFPGQEPIVFTVLYDAVEERWAAHREYHEECRKKRQRPDWKEIGELMQEVTERRDYRLSLVLDEEQFVRYRTWDEERKNWFKSHRRDRKGPDRKGGKKGRERKAPDGPTPPPPDGDASWFPPRAAINSTAVG
jgi:hypothetical protein